MSNIGSFWTFTLLRCISGVLRIRGSLLKEKWPWVDLLPRTLPSSARNQCQLRLPRLHLGVISQLYPLQASFHQGNSKDKIDQKDSTETAFSLFPARRGLLFARSTPSAWLPATWLNCKRAEPNKSPCWYGREFGISSRGPGTRKRRKKCPSNPFHPGKLGFKV